jgi:hypothetical protein
MAVPHAVDSAADAEADPVDVRDLHGRHAPFGADLAAPVTVPGTRRRMTPRTDED